MLEIVISIILFFTLIYPIFMSFIWIFGSLLYTRKRRSENKKNKEIDKFYEYTVVIPVYNEQDHIRDILIKNLKNSYPNLLFWVINDCSTDNTKQELDSINDNRLRVTHLSENVGKAAVLNYALTKIDTEYFVCLDSDSLAYPDAFHILNKQVSNEIDENVAAYAGSLTVDQEGENSNLLKIQKLEYRSIITTIKRTQDYFLKNILTVSGAFVAYKTSVIKEIGGFDPNNATEDIEITWRMTRNGYRAKFLDDFIAEVHSPSISRNLISQRVRWNLGGIQTAKTHRGLLFKPGFIPHKIFMIERFFSVFWIYSFLLTEIIIASKLLFNFPSQTSLDVLVFPTIAILVTGLILQVFAYVLDKGCKEYVDDFISMILVYPVVYWLIQPLGYFGALKRYFFNRNNAGKWRVETRKNLNARKVLSSIIDISIFFTIYHIVRVLLFELTVYLPMNFVAIHYLLIAFWMIIALLIFVYFLNVKYSTIGESILGIKSFRKRSVVYNVTSPVLIVILVDLIFNFTYTIQLIQIRDYNILLETIYSKISQGGIVNPILFLPFFIALLERYFGITERIWKNKLSIKK